MATAVLGSLLPAAIAGVRYWITANVLGIVSLVCFALQGHLSPVLSIVAANVLMALTVLLGLEGCRRFFGREQPLLLGYAGVGVVLLGIVYWTFYAPSFNARVALVSAFHACMCAAIGFVVLRLRPPARPKYSYYFVASVALLFAVGHTVRGTVYGLGLLSQDALLQVSAINIAFLALGILALPSLSIGIVMLAHDRMAERLERLASIDDLTGSLTRREFLARAETLLKVAARSGEPLSLAIIDIDRFKSINDRHGHAAGDKVLAHFASAVNASLRAVDSFGRLGGEEFGVIYPATARADAVRVLNRLRNQVAAGYPASPGVTLDYTFSVGVDQHRHGESLTAWMARVDAALYSAKLSGRDRVVEAM